LKRVTTSRSTCRKIPDLYDIDTGSLIVTHDKRSEVVVKFYKDLYSPTEIGEEAWQIYCENGLLAKMIIENATQFYEESQFDLGLLLD
jgi:hypothetical protein